MAMPYGELDIVSFYLLFHLWRREDLSSALEKKKK